MLITQSASDRSVLTENVATLILTIGPPQRDLLMRMYDGFDPLGAAFGLPPRRIEARRQWIDGALGQIVNLAAFFPGRGGSGALLPGDPSDWVRGVGDFCSPSLSRERRRNGTGEGGDRVGKGGGFAACVEHDRFRQQGGFAPAAGLWLPCDEVRFF